MRVSIVHQLRVADDRSIVSLLILVPCTEKHAFADAHLLAGSAQLRHRVDRRKSRMFLFFSTFAATVKSTTTAKQVLAREDIGAQVGDLLST